MKQVDERQNGRGTGLAREHGAAVATAEGLRGLEEGVAEGGEGCNRGDRSGARRRSGGA